MTWLTGLVMVVGGYLWGSIPTANAIARLRGIDLRESGSGNPGANNARRLGGARLGVTVLLVEVAKGFVAVLAASRLAGDWFGAAAGAAAVAGNVVNPWYRFRGGQGLGIAAGVLLAGSPSSAGIGIISAAVTAAAFHSSPAGGLGGLVGAAVGLILPTGWGLEEGPARWLVALLLAVVAPRQIRNLRRDLAVRRSARQPSRAGS